MAEADVLGGLLAFRRARAGRGGGIDPIRRYSAGVAVIGCFSLRVEMKKPASGVAGFRMGVICLSGSSVAGPAKFLGVRWWSSRAGWCCESVG